MVDLGVTIHPIACNGRWSLRAAMDDALQLETAWGARLPNEPLGSVSGEGRVAFRLGPDEWLLLSEDANAADSLWVPGASFPFSLVDISHRQLSFAITGDGSDEVIGAGCPLDLSNQAFPVGRATRTLYGKAEIVLWRREAAYWRIEVLRSFADYLSKRVEAAVADHHGSPRLKG